MSRASEFFGDDNGCTSESEMRARIGHYGRQRDDGKPDPEIGCIMLRDIRFFDPA